MWFKAIQSDWRSHPPYTPSAAGTVTNLTEVQGTRFMLTKDIVLIINFSLWPREDTNDTSQKRYYHTLIPLSVQTDHEKPADALIYACAFDWIIHFPTCGLWLKACCCRTSCSLQGALGCWGQCLYPLQTPPTVKYANQTEFGSSLQSRLWCFFLSVAVWDFALGCQDGWRSFVDLRWWVWRAAWAEGKGCVDSSSL